MSEFKWQVCNNMGVYQVWRQTRPLRYGEPMHSGVRESGGLFDTLEDAEKRAAHLNGKELEDKAKICELLIAALRETRKFSYLQTLEYIQENDMEFVQGTFANGYTNKLDVTADSGRAMIEDIVRRL